MKRVMLTFAIALCLGALVGYFSRSSARQAREMETKRSVREERAEVKEWSGDDLLKLTADGMRENREKGNGPLTDRLADWSTDELRAALEESVKSPDAMFRNTPGSRVEYALMAEWMKRDHEAAVAWFEGVESDYARARMALTITGAWPKEDAMAGLDFYMKHRALHGQWQPFSLHANVFNQAAASGPAALEEVLRRYGKEMIHLNSQIDLAFPEGFDFRTLVAGEEFKKLEKRGQISPLVSEWSDRDPAGAFSWMMEQGGMERASSMAGMYGKEPEQRLKWLGGEMSGWSAEQREELAESALSSWRSKPEALKYLAEGVKDPALAEELRVHSIQAIYYQGRAQQALEVLGGIPDPARRIELLLTTERAAGGGDAPPLSAAGEHTMRTLLPEWNATPEQIETIIQRFKQ